MTKIQASLIIEMLGRPAEHLKESLNTVVVKMGSEQGVRVIDKTYHDPQLAEGSKDLFTAFAEIDVELDSMANYFAVLFAYLPAHIEITNPESLNIQNHELNEIGNAVVQRIHNYDAIVKKVLTERQMLEQKLKQVAPEVLKKLETQVKEPTKKTKPKRSTKKKSR